MAEANNKFRQQFITIVQTGVSTFDRKYDKRLAHDLVYIAVTMPDELFTEKEYFPYTYACGLLDFEYGRFDKSERMSTFRGGVEKILA